MGREILKQATKDGVKFVCLQFTDVTGAVKSVDIPVKRLERAIDEGVWFDGSSIEGFARIQESDMRLLPDADTYSVLPWSDQSADGPGCSVISTIRMELRLKAIRVAFSRGRAGALERISGNSM